MHTLPRPLFPPRVRFLGGAWTLIDERWRYRLHAAHWRLYCNADAGAWIDHPHGRTDLAVGKAVLVPPWGEFYSGCGGRVRHLFIHLSLEGLEAWNPQPLLQRPQVLSPHAAITELVQRCQDPQVAPWWPDLLARSAMAHWFAQLPPQASHELRRVMDASDPLAPALKQVREQLHGPLTVAALAAACACSEDTLARRMRQRFGCTPAQWLRRSRCARAAELLETSDAGIDDIAQDCGFADRSTLTRAFTQVMGLGPAQHRREARRWGR